VINTIKRFCSQKSIFDVEQEMTTRGPAKESSVGASASTVKPLTYVRDASGKNNYAAWLEEVIDKIGKDFGRVATVLKTHVAYEVPPIAEEDYIPADLPVGMILTEANRRELFLKSFSLRHEKLKALEDESPKFYRAIWATLSEESRALLSAQPGYDGPDGWGARERPNDLLAAIRLTHFTNENAIEGPGMAELNLQMKEAAFANFRQLPGVPISKFKKEFLERVAALEAAGGAVDPEPRKAMKFLNKLDKERHGRMLIRLKNDALRGVAAYPATVEEAYTLAFTWTADDLAGMRTAADGSSIFVLSDDIRPAPNKKPPSQGPPAGASAQRKGSGTGRSGEGGTHSKGDYKPSPEEEAARQAYLKLRTCHGCGKPGHIVRRCPERKRGRGG
jgi:hypothetical protein